MLHQDEKILNLSIRQGVNMKFLMKLLKSAAETCDLIKEIHQDKSLSHNQVFEWFKGLKDDGKWLQMTSILDSSTCQ